MPVRKTTRTKKTKEAEPVEDGPVQEINEEAVPSPAPVDPTASKQPEGDSDRQLFFSTDGDEPEQERTRPSDDAEEVKSDHTSSEQVVKESKEHKIKLARRMGFAKESSEALSQFEESLYAVMGTIKNLFSKYYER